MIVAERDQPILGLQACEKLNLIQRVCTVKTEEQLIDQTYAQLLNEYNDVFQGLGCLPWEHKITVDESVRPVIHACRKVPFRVRDKSKGELDRMENMGVISKVNEPTEWVSSLVIVDKKNGKLRVCLDPKDLNKAIKREHFKLPSREEIMAEFADAKYFSKLDASSGFWQMMLDDTSSKLCTFITPFGRYRFLRLPFGIVSAPEVYHRTINALFQDIVGVNTSMDDIIVWGRTKLSMMRGSDRCWMLHVRQT